MKLQICQSFDVSIKVDLFINRLSSSINVVNAKQLVPDKPTEHTDKELQPATEKVFQSLKVALTVVLLVISCEHHVCIYTTCLYLMSLWLLLYAVYSIRFRSREFLFFSALVSKHLDTFKSAFIDSNLSWTGFRCIVGLNPTLTSTCE